jgi:hypothetical protein
MDPAIADELSDRMLGIARDVLGEDLRAMIVKGSAIKGDFIPDFSDFDVHIFAGDSVMRGPLTPVADVAIPFQRQFAEIDVPSYRVSQIQVMFISATDHPSDWVPALPGTFRLLHGALPESLPAISDEMILRHATAGLERYRDWIDTILSRIVDKPLPQFADNVRLAGTLMKAALYEAAIVLGARPTEAWLTPLSEMLDIVEPRIMPRRPATRYYRHAWEWATAREDGGTLSTMLADAIEALELLSRAGETA